MAYPADILSFQAAPPKERRVAPRMLVYSHDLHDARFHKRLRTFSDAGFSMRWLAYDRGRQTSLADGYLSGMPGEVLGKARDAQYIRRTWGMLWSLAKLVRPGVFPSQIDVVYCINLDNLLVAILAKIIRRHRCKVVYEVADIQPVLLREDRVGRALRALERWCLRNTNLVVLTSEQYLSEFLRQRQGYRGASLLLENKIYPAPGGNRPGSQRRLAVGSPWRVGFPGQLKCRRSFEIIQRLAAEFPAKLRFVLRGYPNDVLRPLFQRLAGSMPNVNYGGPYSYPSDLPALYGSMDLCWGFDFCSPGANSKWTLANRLYEAGYFGVPVLVEEGTAGGEYVRRIGSGWVLPQPVEDSLRTFFSRLDAADLQAKIDHTLRLDPSLFLLDSDLPRIQTALLQVLSPDEARHGILRRRFV